MGSGTYQTYTEETPVETYRGDTIHRGAMCAALSKRYPGLGTTAKEADDILVQIDTRRADLQQAEDDQIRARAVEEAEKLDVVDAYTEIRRTLAAKHKDVMTLLPDAPSTLGRLGAKNFSERADQAVSNLKTLLDTDPVKIALLPTLEKELAEFKVADLAEDATRTSLQSGRMALVLYKTELSQAREAQLGAIQNVLGDREKTAKFTLPWRKASTKATDDSAATPAPAPAASPAAPKTP